MGLYRQYFMDSRILGNQRGPRYIVDMPNFRPKVSLIKIQKDDFFSVLDFKTDETELKHWGVILVHKIFPESDP